MSQPTNWGVPRTDGGNEYTPEQFAERTDDSFDALLSLHKGNSRPAYAEAGTLWLDDSATPWVLKLFDGSDDITIGTVNPSDNKFIPANTLQPTITTAVTFNLPLTTGTQLINLQQGYGIYSDNIGTGSANSRLWLAGPDGGEVIIGPRAGAEFLHQVRLRANTARIEGNCVVTGSLAIDGSAAYHRGNILGTVSQSGGSPTGAIIERGSNANGQYVRYADGTQICHFYGTVTNQTINNAYASTGLFLGERTWTFPAQFASNHIVAFHQGRWSTGGSWSTLAGVTTTAAEFRFIDAVSRSTGFAFVLNFVAIGRWF